MLRDHDWGENKGTISGSYYHFESQKKAGLFYPLGTIGPIPRACELFNSP